MNAENVSADREDDGWLPEEFSLPRAAAVDNLATALKGKSLSAGSVKTLARAAVRPDDMRRKLADPTELRVQGGTLLTVETRLWSAAVVQHPANPREYGHRVYPLGDDSGSEGLGLHEPSSVPAGRPELLLHVQHPEMLNARLADAQHRLVKANRLIEDIAVEGVLQPLTVVPMIVNHRNNRKSVAVLAAADGSSRISAVQQILDYSPGELIYDLSEDDRKFRQVLASQIRLLQKTGWDGLAESEKSRIRVLTVPARVVIGFLPDARSKTQFHTAVRNLIGLTHIRPPKSYGSAVENEAKADAVLDALSQPLLTRSARITDEEKRWFGGTITRAEALRLGFPDYEDVRAADIVQAILAGGNATARRVNSGIRSLTAKLSPKRDERVDIAVELILRPLRTRVHDDAKYVPARRAVLQRAYRLPEIVDLPADVLLEGSKVDDPTLEQLRDDALDEVAAGHGDNGRLAPAQTELAIKAAYYMAVAEPMALKREIFGGVGDEDDRSPAVVIRAMLSRRSGVLQAYQIVKSGRLGRTLYEYDERGKRVIVKSKPRELTDELVRNTYTGKAVKDAAVGYAAASQHWAGVTDAVQRLRKSVKAMEAVPIHEGGPSLIEREGWDTREISKLRSVIDDIDLQLGNWGNRYKDQRSAERPSEDDQSRADADW